MDAETRTLVELTVAAAIMCAGMIVAFVGVVFIRRRYQKTQQLNDQQPFTLDSLRQIHRLGQITDEEFAKAKQQMIQQLGLGAGGKITADGSKTCPPDDGTLSS